MNEQMIPSNGESRVDNLGGSTKAEKDRREQSGMPSATRPTPVRLANNLLMAFGFEDSGFLRTSSFGFRICGSPARITTRQTYTLELWR